MTKQKIEVSTEYIYKIKFLNFNLEKNPQTQIGRFSQMRLINENGLLMKANILGESPSEEAAHRFFTKQLFLKQSQSSQGNTYARV